MNIYEAWIELGEHFQERHNTNGLFYGICSQLNTLSACELISADTFCKMVGTIEEERKRRRKGEGDYFWSEHSPKRAEFCFEQARKIRESNKNVNSRSK